MREGRGLLQDVWSSRTSILGGALAVVAAMLMVTSLLLDALGSPSGEYRGLVAYGLMPAIFILGLLLIPFGVFLAHRKARRSGTPLTPLSLDLGNPLHRRRVALFLALTAFNSVLLSFALYEGYHYTDSTAFCGTVCHTVMQPEYTAYLRSPHARVTCVQCHIGSGAAWYVRAKFSGLRQVWAVLTHSYHRPIPTPVENLRPARDTCEACHWPSMFHGRRIKTWIHPPEEPGGENLLTAVLLKTGGAKPGTGHYTGIHWHVSPNTTVEYLASDAQRSLIKRIRVLHPDGRREEFSSPGVPEPPPGTLWRRMDCVDCHNRPTHVFDDPAEAIDRALVQGALPSSLPGLRKTAFELLTAHYTSASQAETAIRSGLVARYGNSPVLPRTVQELSTIWQSNVFPEMGIGWNTHPTQLGHHREGAGCFRCHDETHASSAGRTLSQDCSLCHELLSQDEPISRLPEGVRPMLD